MQGASSAPPARPTLLALPRPWLVGVLHLPALPGSPGSRLAVDDTAAMAVEDARLLEELGFDAVLVENFHDVPFFAGSVPPETVAALAVVAREVAMAVSLPVGINVLRNDALAGLAVAHVSGLAFQRVNVLAGAAVTDQGLVQGQAHTLLRRRADLGARVAILADVDVKHATSLDTRPVAARARDLVSRSLADGVLVTGEATGSPVDPALLGEVAQAVHPAPVLAASGTTPGSLPGILGCCAGAIVGTGLKNPETGRVDPERAAAYTKQAHR